MPDEGPDQASQRRPWIIVVLCSVPEGELTLISKHPYIRWLTYLD